MQNAGRSWANWVNVEHFHLKSAFVINRFLGVRYCGLSNWPYFTFRCDLSTDPKQRLALFKRLEETNVTRKPVSQPSRQTLPRKEYFQGKKHIPTNTVIWTIRSCYHKVLCRVCDCIIQTPNPQTQKMLKKNAVLMCNMHPKNEEIFNEYFWSHWGAYLDNVFQALKSNILDIIHLIIYI